MMSLVNEELERYAQEHTSPEPPLLADLRRETQRTLPDPQMQVGPIEGQLLRMLTQVSGARLALEIGTYSGYSALCIASGLPARGRLITCEIDPQVSSVAQQYFSKSPHGYKIELRLAPATETLAELAADDTRLDLVFLDADKERYVEYWDAVVPLVRDGGLIIADNTLWSGRVLHPTGESDHGVVRFNTHVAQDPRVEQVILSVRDGIMLARKL